MGTECSKPMDPPMLRRDRLPSRARNGSVAAGSKRSDRDTGTQSVHSDSNANGVSGAWGSNPSITAASVGVPQPHEGSFRQDSKKTVDESNASSELVGEHNAASDSQVNQAPASPVRSLPKAESQLSCDSSGLPLSSAVRNPLSLPTLGEGEGMPKVYMIPTRIAADNPLSRQSTESGSNLVRATSAPASRSPSMPSHADEFERLLMEVAWEDDDNGEEQT